jgi:BirA family biotin operon repressor/biotin-[acetyl-CoA-carboxylase] ligase
MVTQAAGVKRPFRVNTMSADYPLPDAEWHLPTRLIGRRVLVYDRVDSTNEVAAVLAAEPGQDGAVVLAREQTAGRGQHRRGWDCPPGRGVLLSVLLFPPPALRRPVVLTAWAAVAVAETVREITGQQALIKWPNDVLLHGRKVCGILIEQGRGTVVGIGLNVTQTAEDFAAAGLPGAGSLALFTGGLPAVESVARQLLTRLDEGYDGLLRGDVTTLEACWKTGVGLLGREVIAVCTDGTTVRGRLRECTFAGLELERANSLSVMLMPERVRGLKTED